MKGDLKNNNSMSQSLVRDSENINDALFNYSRFLENANNEGETSIFNTGLYYFNARWYDPQIGRFTTEDPIRSGLNWYIYANNNPLKFVDPTGLEIVKQSSYFSMTGNDTKLGNSNTETISDYGCYITAMANAKNSMDVAPVRPGMKLDLIFGSQQDINNTKSLFALDSGNLNGRKEPMDALFGRGGWDYWTKENQGAEKMADIIKEYSDSDKNYMILGIFDISSEVEGATTHMVGLNGVADENGQFSAENIVNSSDFDTNRKENTDVYSMDNLTEIRVIFLDNDTE